MSLEAGLIAMSAIPTLFGTGQRVKVPGSIARPTDPATKILDDNYYVKDQFKLEGYNPEGYNQAKGNLDTLNTMANKQGPTREAQYLMDANAKNSEMQKANLLSDTASQMASTTSSLAMKSGLGSGARERLNNQMSVNNVNNMNQINSQGSLNNMNILANDEKMKRGLLSDLSGSYMNMANHNLGKKEFDVKNSLGTANRTYDQQMKEYSANQLARSQAQSFNKSNKGVLGGLF